MSGVDRGGGAEAGALAAITAAASLLIAVSPTAAELRAQLLAMAAYADVTEPGTPWTQGFVLALRKITLAPASGG